MSRRGNACLSYPCCGLCFTRRLSGVPGAWLPPPADAARFLARRPPPAPPAPRPPAAPAPAPAAPAPAPPAPEPAPAAPPARCGCGCGYLTGSIGYLTTHGGTR